MQNEVKRVTARLAQMVERKTLNLVVAGSSPAVGGCGENLLVSLVGQDSRLSPDRHGFNSRTRNSCISKKQQGFHGSVGRAVGC